MSVNVDMNKFAYVLQLKKKEKAAEILLLFLFFFLNECKTQAISDLLND